MRTILCYVVLLVTTAVYSQSASVLQYAESAGLERADVRVIFQDARGLLWIGTNGAGLYQFNQGRFHQDMEMVRSVGYVIHGISEDADGALYFWSDRGLFQYDGYIFSRIELPGDPLIAVTMCADDLWIATATGLYYGSTFEQIVSQEVTCLECTEGGELIAVGRDSTWMISGDRVLAYALPPARANWTSLTTSREGDLWLANTLGQVLHFKAGKTEIVETGLEINCLQATGGGQIWIGANDGLFAFTGDESVFIPVNDVRKTLATPIHGIVFDQADHLWIGSETMGLLQYLGNKFLTEACDIGEIVQMQMDPEQGVLWYRDTQGMLYQWIDGESQPAVIAATAMQPCTAFYCDHLGRKWAAHGAQGVFVQLADGTELHLDSLLQIPLADMIEITGDAFGTIWMESSDGSIYSLGFQQKPGVLLPVWEAHVIDWRARDALVQFIPRADQSAIRVGRRSVSLIDHSTAGVISETMHDVLAASLDQEGVLWLGTSAGGVQYLDVSFGGIPQDLRTPYALQPYDIHFICADRGALWVGTDRAVLHLQLDIDRARVTEVAEVLSAPPGAFRPERFTITHEQAIMALTDDELFRINTDAYQPIAPVPTVFVRDVQINQVSVLEYAQSTTFGAFGIQHETPSIPFRQNSIAFTIQGISRSDLQLYYRWRLPPLYPDWSEPSSRTAITFAGLPPGKFAFDVMVCSDRGKCSQLERTWEFEIRKSLRHRWLFWVGVAGVLAVLAFVFTRRRERRIKRAAAVEQERLAAQLRALTLEQKALRLQMNPHFMFNAMQTIQHQLSQGQLENARNNLTRFARLMRMTLDMSRSEQISLEDELAYLEAYIEVEKICSTKPIRFKMTVDPELEPFAVMIPPMVFQPVLENAIKHGAGNPVPSIEVEFRELHGKLQGLVRDNGAGFPENGQPAAGSAALDILRQRIAQYGEASLDVSNRTDATGKTLGAEVSIVLPIKEDQ